MIGVTIGSLKRNVIDSEYGIKALSNNILTDKTDSQGYQYLTIKGTNKRVYMFGGNNKASFKLFKGITAGGVYIDEVSECHSNTIAESFNRTVASADRRHIWTLNPDVPTHWIYRDYLDGYDKNKTKGYKWFHFLLDDNPVLTDERKEELRFQYTGIFYKRYVLGLRVRAEGGCYPSWNDDLIIDQVKPEWVINLVNIGIDIGGNKSATSFTATGFFFLNGRWNLVVLDEDYDIKNKSVESVLENYRKFIFKIKAKYPIAEVYVDSAEQLILKSIKNLALANVRGSLKKPIVDRIRFLDLMLSQGRAWFLKDCRHTTDAIQSAVWDLKSSKEERLDDGTMNIDSLDSLEYSFEKRMRDFV